MGWNKLSRPENIAEIMQKILNGEKVVAPQNVYGDDHSSKKIAEIPLKTRTCTKLSLYQGVPSL